MFSSFSYADVFIGAPLFMDRGSDGKLQEVGQVSVSLQRAVGDFQTTKLNGFEVFARFGSAIAPLGDLDQDGFNGKIQAPFCVTRGSPKTPCTGAPMCKPPGKMESTSQTPNLKPDCYFFFLENEQKMSKLGFHELEMIEF
jgi:hypothetical protein